MFWTKYSINKSDIRQEKRKTDRRTAEVDFISVNVSSRENIKNELRFVRLH